MPWLWTDDLARLLIEAGRADAARLESWLTRPVAIAVAGDTDSLGIADALLQDEELDMSGAA